MRPSEFSEFARAFRECSERRHQVAMIEYEAVIGLEVHAQLLTESKLFCSCPVQVGNGPNQQVCPVCLGLPGSLPAINQRAIELAVRAARALECEIVSESVFARKHYFYPDLPKGYQISQFERPFSIDGRLEIELEDRRFTAVIQRVHLEEDAGKNVHGVGGQSLVDLNRAGTPLIEIVGAPDLHSGVEAAAYLRTLREILVFIGVNDGNLEEGSFRCDANVSIRPRGSSELGTRTELKNINSFKFVQRAIEVEISRQSAVLDAGGSVVQETRCFDPDTGKTASLRSKADAHDYRYFPEPDLPPLVIPQQIVEEQQQLAQNLPRTIRKRFCDELGLTPDAAATLTQHPEVTRFFESVLQTFPHPVPAANWIQTEVLRDTEYDGLSARFPVAARQVADLLELVRSKKISGAQAKKVHSALSGTQRTAADVVGELGLSVVGSEDDLLPVCKAVLADNAANVASYRSGKTGLLGFFMGQVMKRTKGRADPRLSSELLRRLLDAGREEES